MTPALYLPPKPAIIRPAEVRKANFLPGGFPGPVMALGARPVRVEYGDAAGSSSNPQNTYNYGTKNLGTVEPSRVMVLLAWSSNSNLVGDTTGPSSVSIGGTSATRRATLPASSSIARWGCWVTARADSGGPTTSTGNVTISRSTGNGFEWCHWVLWALYDLQDELPADFDLASFADPSTATLVVSRGGAVVAIAGYSTTGAFVWTGPTEDADFITGVSSSQRVTGSHAEITADNAAYEATANGAGGSNTFGVSFR